MEPHRTGHRARVGSLIATIVARSSAWWRNVTRRTQVQGDLDEELRSQLQMLVDDYAARGVPLKEGVRCVRRGHWLDEMIGGVRYGCRSLVRNPTFTVVGILTIALGIGVNTTVFTIVNSVVFRLFTVPSGGPIISITQRLDGDARR